MKTTLEELQAKNELVYLDIGCGKIKHGNIGIDIYDGENVDYVMDINKGINFPSASVDGVWMSHVLEHVNDPVFVLEEIKRVLKPGGVAEIMVPHHSNPSAFVVHHKSYWNSLSIGSKQHQKKSCQDSAILPAIKVELNLLRFKWLNRFFSQHLYWYEAYFFRLFPCYEVKFTLRKEL